MSSDDYCEMCGKRAPLKQYTIDGAVVEACPQCGRFGKLVVQQPAKVPDQQRWKADSKNTEISPSTARVQSRPVTQSRQRRQVGSLGEDMLIDNYGSVISNVRMKAGLERKELAKRINETESLILRIEQEKIRPDDRVVRKLEKFFKIKLTTTSAGALSTAEFLEKPGAKGMTLGDVVHIKKKKQKE